MKRRSGELQVFSMSFLDLLSCALGGILLLYLALLTQNKKQTEAYAAELEQMDARVAEAMEQLAQAQQSRDSAQEQIEQLQSIQSTLIGFQGDGKNVVFVFDHSGSMANLQGSKDYDDYVELLKSYVSTLPFERFAVVVFGDKISTSVSSPTLASNSQSDRDAALRFIDTFQPDGQATETLKALEAAFSFSNIDTIVLMSDGEPTTASIPGDYSNLVGIAHDDVHNRVAQLNAGRGVTINTVAMGDYFRNSQLGPFLKKLASDNNGAYLGQ